MAPRGQRRKLVLQRQIQAGRLALLCVVQVLSSGATGDLGEGGAVVWAPGFFARFGGFTHGACGGAGDVKVAAVHMVILITTTITSTFQASRATPNFTIETENPRQPNSSFPPPLA